MIFWENSSSNVKIQFSSKERGDSVAEQQILDRMNIIIATLRSLSIFLLEVPMTLNSNYKCRWRNSKSVIFWIDIRKKHVVLIILIFESRSNGYPFLFIFLNLSMSSWSRIEAIHSNIMMTIRSIGSRYVFWSLTTRLLPKRNAPSFDDDEIENLRSLIRYLDADWIVSFLRYFQDNIFRVWVWTTR